MMSLINSHSCILFSSHKWTTSPSITILSLPVFWLYLQVLFCTVCSLKFHQQVFHYSQKSHFFILSSLSSSFPSCYSFTFQQSLELELLPTLPFLHYESLSNLYTSSKHFHSSLRFLSVSFLAFSQQFHEHKKYLLITQDASVGFPSIPVQAIRSILWQYQFCLLILSIQVMTASVALPFRKVDISNKVFQYIRLCFDTSLCPHSSASVPRLAQSKTSIISLSLLNTPQ